MELLIPSAKIVTRELQRIGKLPPIIYPLNDAIVFDYIFKQYSEHVDGMTVLCYDQAEKVNHRLNQYVQEHTVKVEKIPQMDDLGYTIWCGLAAVQGGVIVNFADTIVQENIFDTEGDCFFYSQDIQSSLWTFFEERDGYITAIYDKMETLPTEQGKLFVGVFQFADAQLLRKCLEEAMMRDDGEKRTDSFYCAICRYSHLRPMKMIPTQKWFDIGHVDRYFTSKLEVQAREFNHISIDHNRGILRKTSDEKKKFIGEIVWYLKLPNDIEYVRPRVFSYSVHYDSPYIEMEYYSYHTLHELFLYGDLGARQWRSIFERILFICNDFARYSVAGEGLQEATQEMYLDKTLLRLNMLREDPKFAGFFSQELTINHVKYHSLDAICTLLSAQIPQWLCEIDHFTIIHGDMCFSNIMVDNDFRFIKLIDPRGKFGHFDIYGDPRYEIAKLFHSLDGKYDFIIKDMFSLDVDLQKCEIDFAITERNRGYNLLEIFLDVFRNMIGADQQKIELIEALLFLSMIPLHQEDSRHQYVMLGTGIEILDRILDIRA